MDYSNANGQFNCWARHPFNSTKRAECEQGYIDLEGRAVVQENMSNTQNNTWGQTPNVGGVPINTTVQTNQPTQNQNGSVDTVQSDISSQSSDNTWKIISIVSIGLTVVLLIKSFIPNKNN